MRAPGTPQALTSLLWPVGAGLGLSLLGLLPAGAHGTADAGLLGGAIHPLLGLDHLLLLLAVGTTSALAGAALLWVAAAAAVLGACFGSLGGSLPGAEILAALVITALSAVLLQHLRRQQRERSAGWGLVATVLAAAVALHAMLHGLESSGQPAWWLGAGLSSVAVVGITHLGISRMQPRLAQVIPAAVAVGSAALAVAALA